MVKKKQPAEEPPRVPTFRFLDHLKEYDDFDVQELTSIEDLLRKGRAPRDFPLRVGQLRVGSADISWYSVLMAFFGWTNGLGRPITDEELESQINNLGDVDFKAIKGLLDHYTPALAMYFYMAEHLPEKLSQAMQDLALEAHHHASTVTETTQQLATPFANTITRREKNAIVKRLNERGKKPKSNRGQRPKWTDSEAFVNAMREAVGTLKQQDSANHEKLSTQDYKLRERLAEELNRLYPDKAPTTGESLRKLIERYNLEPEWETLKRDWASPLPPISGH